MNSPFNGRSQRSKGKRIKLAFQIASLLAVCLWLLYQAKQSHDKDYSQSEVSERHSSGILGRKANAGGLNHVEESLTDEDRGDGVDVLVGSVEEKHMVNEDSHGGMGRHEEESEKKVELIYRKLNSTDDNIDIELKANSEAVGVDDNSLQEGKFQAGHDDKQATMSDQDGAKDAKNTSHEFGEDEEQISHVNHDEQEHERYIQNSSNNEFLVQPSERKNDSLQDHNSLVDGVHGFDDENGVPEDGDGIIESRVTGSSGDGEIYSDSQSETDESTQTEEVVAIGDSADFEARSKISVQHSEPKGDTNSETSVHVDTI